MRSVEVVITAVTTAAVVLVVGGFATPLVFAERLLPGLHVGDTQLYGLSEDDLMGVLERLGSSLLAQTVTVQLADDTADHMIAELGVSLDVKATTKKIAGRSWYQALRGQTTIEPILVVNSRVLNTAVQADFGSHINPPQNATLELTPAGGLAVVPSAGGQGVDLTTFEQDVLSRAYSRAWGEPIDLLLVSASPTVHEAEVVQAQVLADQLLTKGFTLTFGEEEFTIKPFTIRRLLSFTEVREAANADNTILGVTFDDVELANYLDTTLSPVIDQQAVNARLELSESADTQLRATQFALPEPGQELEGVPTAERIVQALAHGITTAELEVVITEPDVKGIADIEELRITTLLARGESDFAGSPSNRRFNIDIGTSRYHGVLIKPGDEFSFNDLLGPVDGAHGFKQELVIKANLTVPEFGGGLCQVSTTAFRAALRSGLPITERRNHSYAVRYYGTPGFDATIYPGNTDLRFTNDTPGYLLVQARVEGTKLVFEFWGTDDGRQVEIAGPSPYDRQPDGSVKATLTQTVTRDGQVLIDETFYSRYKSPNLFPRAQALDKPV